MSRIMTKPAEISLAEQIRAALDWWRDAGVDYDFTYDVQPWLSEEKEEAQDQGAAGKWTGSAPTQGHKPAVDTIALPDKPDEFARWWASADNPFLAGPASPIAPRGVTKARLMMLVPMPEANDTDTLLSGPQGEMLANIGKALKIASEELYLASALPMYLPHPDWEALAKDGLGKALRHHLRLAAPERVLLFGTRLPGLLGHEGSPEKLREVEGIAALATFAPDRLLQHKRQRALLWERLQQWIAQ